MIRPVFIRGRISIIRYIGGVGNVGGKGLVTIPGGLVDSLGPRLGTFPQQVFTYSGSQTMMHPKRTVLR